MAKSKKPFEVVVEAKLVVRAFDEKSARKKAEAALAHRSDLAADVALVGEGWVYDAVRLQP